MRSGVPRFTPREVEFVRRAKEAEERAHAVALKGPRFAGKLPAGYGRVRNRVAELCGISRRQVDKIAEIFAAAEAEPELYGRFVDELDRKPNSVDGVHRKLDRARDEARVLGLAPVEGRFLTMVFDPPWEDESVSEAQRPAYATMPLAEIRAIPVPSWQLDQGHIYVHAPGPFVGIAIQLVEEWGYGFKSLIAWQKSKWSMGRYFRTLDEFVVFGVRGGLRLRRQDIPNHFTGPVGEHSEKPEAFYDMVRRASYPPFAEGFQRRARPDFTNLYQPAPLAVAAE